MQNRERIPSRQPGWGGGSDRMLALKSALAVVRYHQETYSGPFARLSLGPGRYRDRVKTLNRRRP